MFVLSIASGTSLKQFLHLILRLEIKLVVGKFKSPVFQMYIIIHKIIITRGAFLFACIDAKKNVVRIVIVLVSIMAVVGSDYRNIIFLCEF